MRVILPFGVSIPYAKTMLISIHTLKIDCYLFHHGINVNAFFKHYVLSDSSRYKN